VNTLRPNDSKGGQEDVLPQRVRVYLERDYAIEGEVGRGGMATVWRARRRRDNALVAIKVLRPVLAEAVGSRRFLREIEIAAGTRSDLLVPLEESGEAEGLPYYVMPYIEGESLRQRLTRDRQLSIEETVRIARSVALALVELHHDGILHRDVKPENILLRGSDVLVADYSISRALTASGVESLTSTGVVVGTPAYMSPEQAGGDNIDARSDQYSWGCVVYEMLIGMQPFQGATTQAVIARHMRENVPSLRVVRPSVPESLEAVVLKAMAKVRADRFDNISLLLEALDRVDVKNITGSFPAPARDRRRTAVIGAVAVAGAALAWLGWQQTHPPLNPDRVALFPLVADDAERQSEASQASIIVRGALEDIEPQRWIDGASLVPVEQQNKPIDPSRARSLTRKARARYYVAGSVMHRSTDSVRVAVTLTDLEGELDTTVVASGLASSVTDIATNAMVALLPRLTGLERQINPASVIGKAPAAVSNWLRGEREYRASRMDQALDYIRRALAVDSTLAPAAIRGAMAASWSDDEHEASQFVALAQRQRGMLSSSQAALVEALRLYLKGAADSAVVAVRHALGAAPQAPEPWMLTGEIFQHLQPSFPLDSQQLRAVPAPATLPLDSLAEDAFRRARAADSGFTPPLQHLAEAAARRGDAGRLDSLAGLLRRGGGDSAYLRHLAIVRRCLTSRMSASDWTSLARSEAAATYRLAVVMSGASDPKAIACVEGAWSGIRSSEPADPGLAFAAVVARFSQLAARRDTSAALALLDSAAASGMRAALAVFVVGEAAGVDPGSRADAFVAQLDSLIASRPAYSAWILARWGVRSADTLKLARARARLEALKAAGGTRLDSLMGSVVNAYQVLARGDTTAALRAFGELSPTAARTVLQGSLWETLAAERLVYARLLLARGLPAAAHRVASVFDQSGFYLNPLFLRPSLEIRAQAARMLGDEGLRRQAEERLRPRSSVPR